MLKYYHGEYQVENKDKYLGHKNPRFRSSWESRFCYWCDHNVNVLKWGYEVIDIKYFNPVTNKVQRYYPDFYLEIKQPDGSVKKYLAEVKPSKQTEPPQKPKNRNQKRLKRYMVETEMYVVNQSKWQSAMKFCAKRGLTWKIVTEKDLFE